MQRLKLKASIQKHLLQFKLLFVKDVVGNKLIGFRGFSLVDNLSTSN
jgi:hypothetical protein